MTPESILEVLKEVGWEWAKIEYSFLSVKILVSMNSWWTDSLTQSRVLPFGEGATLDEAFINLVRRLGNS